MQPGALFGHGLHKSGEAQFTVVGKRRPVAPEGLALGAPIKLPVTALALSCSGGNKSAFRCSVGMDKHAVRSGDSIGAKLVYEDHTEAAVQ